MNRTSYTSIDEVVRIPSLLSVSVGKNGKYAAYVKRTPDLTENIYRNHTWIYEEDGNKHYPITMGKHESDKPAWAPDNSCLAYIADVGEKEKARKQVFLKTFDEHNGIQVTYAKEGVDRYIWSPDGKGIYYTTAEADSDELKKRKELYGDFVYVDKEYKNSFLCYMGLDQSIDAHIKANSKEPDDKEDLKDPAVALTRSCDFHIKGFDVSSDGKKIVFVCTRTSDIRDHDTSIYLLDVTTKDFSKLNVEGYFSSDISFSPDGSKIVFSKAPNPLDYYTWRVQDNFIMEAYDLEKEKSIMKVAEPDKDLTPVKWTNKGILSLWQDRASYRVVMIAETGEISSIINSDMSFIMDVSITPDGDNIAYIKTSENKAAEVYINNKQLTNESRIYADKLLSKKELIRWHASDGLEIEGVLSKPHDYTPSKPYPLLVVIHGGPTWASFPFHNMNKLYPIEQFVENGYLVLEPNYRGSSGYGNQFLTSNFRMLGIGDYDDVISGVDALIEQGVADKERVGVMGWSQGGYISAFCATYSDRFKAISVGAGISNWTTYYANTDITTFTRSYLGANPWDDPEIYARTSPMTYIKTACTPTLIQHGDKDMRVPVPNAFELYRALQDHHVESELVIFKGMQHGPQKPGLHKAVMEQNLQWFLKHVR